VKRVATLKLDVTKDTSLTRSCDHVGRINTMFGLYLLKYITFQRRSLQRQVMGYNVRRASKGRTNARIVSKPKVYLRILLQRCDKDETD
jgi:hypothetical protein